MYRSFGARCLYVNIILGFIVKHRALNLSAGRFSLFTFKIEYIVFKIRLTIIVFIPVSKRLSVKRNIWKKLNKNSTDYLEPVEESYRKEGNMVLFQLI